MEIIPKIPPVSFIPSYTGYIKNGYMHGYGIIRDNVKKYMQIGYFDNKFLHSDIHNALLVEWTIQPEKIIMINGTFSVGKLNGNDIMYYISQGPLYCKNDDINKYSRKRYVLAKKYIRNYNLGELINSNELDITILEMDWICNNLININENISIVLDNNYIIDDNIKPDTTGLCKSDKTNFIMSFLKDDI
jgi:hypothetical protein